MLRMRRETKGIVSFPDGFLFPVSISCEGWLQFLIQGSSDGRLGLIMNSYSLTVFSYLRLVGVGFC